MSHRAAILEAQGQRLKNDTVKTEASLGPHEVLVANKAIAINPVDWKMRDYDAFMESYPTILGADIAGVVEAVGSDVSAIKKGDRVTSYVYLGKGGKLGAFQEKTVVWDFLLAKIPDSLPFAEASTIPLAFVTSVTALFSDLGLPLPKPNEKPQTKAEPILVYGGSSSVGQYAIQVLKYGGYSNIFVTASSRNHELLKELGATHLVDYNTANPATKLVEANGGRKFKTIFDTISTDASQEVVKKVVDGEGGQIALTLPPAGDYPSGVKVDSTFARKIYDEPHQQLGKDLYKLVEYLLSTGTLKVNKTRVIKVQGDDLASALEEGMELNKKGVSAEKVVITLE